MDGAVHVLSWLAKAEDVIDRHRLLVTTWIADDVWKPRWAAVVDHVRQRFESSLLDLMAYTRNAWSGDRTFRPLLDELRQDAERRIDRLLAVAPDELPARPGPTLGMRLLDMDPDNDRWRELALSLNAAEDVAVTAYLERDDELESAEARELYLHARTGLTRCKIAVRHDHMKRDDLEFRLKDALWKFWQQVMTWLSQVDHVQVELDDRRPEYEQFLEAKRGAAEQLLDDAITRLQAAR